MSGIEQIIPWAEKNYDPAQYGSFEDWYNDIEADFASFNRSPLDDILGDQKSIMEEFWTTKPENVQEFLFNFI
ncbi:MAG: hypothetical protein KGI08_04315 [Thaumarchaeota archaeon]|nr:hypothetical protein [Nitrososphaerota archaeon]